MATAPRFVQAKKTTLLSSITETETAQIVLRNLLDVYGNALAMSDLGIILYLTFNPGGSTEEIISCTDFTVNADGSVAIDTGIVRALSAKYPYGAGGTAQSHYAGETVVISDQPQLYAAILAYIDGIAVAGAPDASQTSKGIVEVATAAEINAGTATGSTGAPLSISPDQLLTSIYGTRLPSAAGAAFVAAASGMVISFAGNSAPTGFLLCDGTSYDNDTYPDLVGVILGRFGYGTGQTFTADASTDTITASSHGLSNGDRVLLTSTTALPAGLSANTVYYVINSATNTFKLSATAGGPAINITDAGTGTHTFYNSFKVPDLRGRAVIGKGTGTIVATFVSRTSNVVTVSGLTNAANNEFQTGQAVVYSAPSGAMTGLTNGVTYYVIRLSNSTISLASSLANAQNGTAIALSSDGTGVQTFTITLTARTTGDMGGEENHAMSITELLAHTHPMNFFTHTSGALPFFSPSGADSTNANVTTNSTGGNAAMNVMSPFAVMSYIIKT